MSDICMCRWHKQRTMETRNNALATAFPHLTGVTTYCFSVEQQLQQHLMQDIVVKDSTDTNNNNNNHHHHASMRRVLPLRNNETNGASVCHATMAFPFASVDKMAAADMNHVLEREPSCSPRGDCALTDVMNMSTSSTLAAAMLADHRRHVSHGHLSAMLQNSAATCELKHRSSTAKERRGPRHVSMHKQRENDDLKSQGDGKTGFMENISKDNDGPLQDSYVSEKCPQKGQVEEQQVVDSEETDSNNNNNNNSDHRDDDFPGIKQACSRKSDKYSLRPRSIQKRLETEERGRMIAASRGSKRGAGAGCRPKQKPPPLSKYRRKTANARERDRMREINAAFESLRRAVPHLSDACNGNEKLTKITTLRLAMKYITALSQALKSPEPELGHLSELDCLLMASDSESLALHSDLSVSVSDTCLSLPDLDDDDDGGDDGDGADEHHLCHHHAGIPAQHAHAQPFTPPQLEDFFS